MMRLTAFLCIHFICLSSAFQTCPYAITNQHRANNKKGRKLSIAHRENIQCMSPSFKKDIALHRQSISLHQMSTNEERDEKEESTMFASSWIDWSGYLSIPLVGTSLFTLASTGAGLPAGPFGIIGGIEGVSYLVVLGFAVSSIWKVISKDNNEKMSTVEKLSLATIILGILTLLSLVADQGCVPNAKPILDFSAYVKVCNP